MYEKFEEKFVQENCQSCKDGYGHGRDGFKNICPIYKLLYSATHGIRDFPVEYIDRENNKCNKNYEIKEIKPQLHRIEKEAKGKESFTQNEKLF